MQTLFCCHFMLLFNIKLKETFPISKSLERKIHLFSNILMVSLIIVKYFTVRNLFWRKEWRFKNLILIFPPSMVSQLSSNYLLINLSFLCWFETSLLSWIKFSYLFRCISRLCSMVSTCLILYTYMLICEGGKQGSVSG